MLETPMVENSALMTRKMHMQHSSAEHQGSEAKRTADGSLSNKDLLWWTYCKKPRHTIDECSKLQGKPQVKVKGHQAIRRGRSRPMWLTHNRLERQIIHNH